MLFLNPAVLFGLLAASIPVLIHLLNLRKLKRIDFSTLAFLKELQKNKIRKIKLKQWLLLALRVLIIAFVVMAFARPALKGVAIGGTTSAAKTTAVFILDNTFSMSVVDNKGSYFNRAKETIKELISQLQEGDEAALIKVAGNGIEESNSTNNLIDLAGKVDASEISYASGYLHDAIAKASGIISASKNFNKEIYIFSDYQSGRLANEGSVSDLSELLNERVKLYTFNYSGKEVFNLGINDLKISTQIFEKDKPVSFDITVENYSGQTVRDAVISLFINGERSSQQSVDISAGSSVTVIMEALIRNNGFINIYAELQDDEIIFDNRRFERMFIPEELPVVIFADNPDDTRFISLALSLSGEENPLKLTVKNSNQIYSSDLSQYKAAVLISGKELNGIEKIQSFLSSGGGLLIMPAGNSEVMNFGSLLAQLGLPAVKGTAGGKNDQSYSFLFEKVEYEHPVFQNIFADIEKNKKKTAANRIESPEIFHHFKINTEGKGRNIISLNDGSSFLSEYKSGKGKIFLMNTAPVLQWNTFPIKSIFVPLITKSIYYLAFVNEGNSGFSAGEIINVNMSLQNSPQVKIERPDNTQEFFKINDMNQFLSYRRTDIAGFYKVYSGEKLFQVLPVNTDPDESSVKYLGGDEFEDYLKKINFKGTLLEIDKDEDPSEQVLQARFGSELWKLALLAALILAIIEMAVARSPKREVISGN